MTHHSKLLGCSSVLAFQESPPWSIWGAQNMRKTWCIYPMTLLLPQWNPLQLSRNHRNRSSCTEEDGMVQETQDGCIILQLLEKRVKVLNGHHMGTGRWLAQVSVLLLLHRLPPACCQRGFRAKCFPMPLARLCLDREPSCRCRQQVLDWAKPGARPQLCHQPLSALMLHGNHLPGLWWWQQTSAKLMGDFIPRSDFLCEMRQNTRVPVASGRQKVGVRAWETMAIWKSKFSVDSLSSSTLCVDTVLFSSMQEAQLFFKMATRKIILGQEPTCC